MTVTRHAAERYLMRFGVPVSLTEAMRRIDAAVADAVEIYTDGETRWLRGWVRRTSRRRDAIELVVRDGKVVTVFRPGSVARQSTQLQSR